MVRRKVCVITGTRAEYGLLKYVMEGLRQSPHCTLQCIATGMHLSPEFGQTYREIEADGFTIDRRVEMLLSSDSPTAIAKSTGIGLMGIADAISDLAPNIVVLLGDRFEALAAASAALLLGVPIAHIHGGEKTTGAYDDSIRHAITKMSHLHFVAAEEYRNRVLQLGEDPSTVHLVGGLGVDGIKRTPLLSKTELQQELDFEWDRCLAITYHPTTLSPLTSETQVAVLLNALDQLEDSISLIFTMPNADSDSRIIVQRIHDFVDSHPRARAYTSLGLTRYLSLIRHAQAVVGNSSSGLLEAPTLETPTVNIGERQDGRLRCASVVDCRCDSEHICSAIFEVVSDAFQQKCKSVVSPYGEGGASDQVVDVLSTAALHDSFLVKNFRDYPQGLSM